VIADLTGRIALVTGAGSGIGAAIATVLAGQGATVAVTDLNLDWARTTAARLGPEHLALRLDVTDPVSVAGAFSDAVGRWGRLDILVNNAGVPADPARQTEWDRDEDWDRTLAINLRGTVRCCEAAIPAMRQQRYGKIVTIASMAAHAARGTVGAYAASKAAVLRYTKGLAMALAPAGINVNAVCPGAVWTRFHAGGPPATARANPRDEMERHYSAMTPLGRTQAAEDIAKAVAFLASGDARNITGQCLHVDGGAILRD
jgi:NAD(P)-dependent dehydrogenase (short-subunit alcohol dehydrogenase family)